MTEPAPAGQDRSKIYTRTGDRGETSLLYYERVSKASPRVEAYGTADEAVSALALARSLCRDPWVCQSILRIQRQMFVVAMELATSPDRYQFLLQQHKAVEAAWVDTLERIIDKVEAEGALPRTFIIPGSTPGSAALDLARSVVRRLERCVVALARGKDLPNPNLVRYLNRLSDAVYALARYEGRDADQVWRETDVEPS
ncbi:MAG: cob(I)yrinic acid a,c-diamide adenosyltransferase [Chloroflexi bacterium]|nr:cob(I)yrinic acid a,c-diamide adenosyltransferase [Chloroflexota bacterium]